MQFVDTTIFIRYFTGDDPEKAQACRHLFEQAKRNEVTLTTSESVIAEIVFILSSKRLYNLSRQDVRIRLYPVLSLQGLRLAHKQQYLRALDLYTSNNIDFEDALSVAFMERNNIAELFSYDQDFDTIEGSSITRVEP